MFLATKEKIVHFDILKDKSLIFIEEDGES